MTLTETELLRIENRRLIEQNELYEIAVVKYTQELAMARAELIACESHREHTRRWLRGELNYDPLDLTPWLCLWCGCKIEGGRAGAKAHAVSCADNPLFARCERMRRALGEPIGTSGATISEILENLACGDMVGDQGGHAVEAVIQTIRNALTPEKPADDAVTVQPGPGSRQDL